MATEAELAGNYVTSGGSGDPAFVAEKLAAMQDEAAERQVDAVSHEQLRDQIEDSDEPELGTIEVAGEVVELTDTLGVGERARLAKQAQTADERDDEVAQVDVVLRMLDALNAISDDDHDQAFWDSLNDTELRAAFQSAAEQSVGGEQAGN